MKQPCYKCKERKAGCHRFCELYKAWKKETEEIKRKIKADHEICEYECRKGFLISQYKERYKKGLKNE